MPSPSSFLLAVGLLMATFLGTSSAAPAGTSPAARGLAIGKIKRIGPATAEPASAQAEDNGTAAAARRGVMPCERYTVLVGDGNPHQNYLNTQLTETVTCDPSNQCAASYTTSTSISWSVSAGAEAYEWLSGGFDVGEEWSVEDSYQCSASPGETTCVWYNTAHTAYTVRNAYLGDCLEVDTEPFVMFSPNKDNVGGGYYCVVGAQYCRTIHSSYWNYDGRAGGP